MALMLVTGVVVKRGRQSNEQFPKASDVHKAVDALRSSASMSGCADPADCEADDSSAVVRRSHTDNFCLHCGNRTHWRA